VFGWLIFHKRRDLDDDRSWVAAEIEDLKRTVEAFTPAERAEFTGILATELRVFFGTPLRSGLTSTGIEREERYRHVADLIALADGQQRRGEVTSWAASALAIHYFIAAMENDDATRRGLGAFLDPYFKSGWQSLAD
jgi:hypothetical protein